MRASSGRFVLVGALVPGISQVLVIHAVDAAGASRAGILFGMSPLFSALIAVVAFDEPLRWPLAVGTLLVVSGGAALAWEAQRPAGYRALGAVLAVFVALLFGIRDNVGRAVTEDVSADALAQSAAVMLGAVAVLVPNLLRQPSALPRLRAALPAFALSAVVTALAQVLLFAALDRTRVTIVAPLTGTGRAVDGAAGGGVPRPQRARRAAAARGVAARRRRERARAAAR